MKTPIRCRPEDGIAMIIVMMVILVLGILAGGFAFSMKVETKLAQNSGFEGDLEWLGRSGIELARYVLVETLNVPAEPWDSLNQKWAGGPMGTNEVLETVSLENNQLGPGSFSIKIIDLERKVNINLINEVSIPIFQAALNAANADPADISTISDSLLDWIDIDENPHLSGSESADYIARPNPGYAPYIAKNGPIDDLSELLLLRGMTPEVYFGPSERGGGAPPPRSPMPMAFLDPMQTAGPPVGLVDLFTPISSGMININTASAQVLQLIPGIDPSLAQAIVTFRAGLDGMEGTEDDTPFRTPGELINVPGMPPTIIQQSTGKFIIRSVTFEVIVDAHVGQYRRQYIGILRRIPGNRDVQTLLFHAR
ncbi:MAG: general secretion pathway protein GspK [Verrucomicrobiota bacterium]